MADDSADRAADDTVDQPADHRQRAGRRPDSQGPRRLRDALMMLSGALVVAAFWALAVTADTDEQSPSDSIGSVQAAGSVESSRPNAAVDNRGGGRYEWASAHGSAAGPSVPLIEVKGVTAKADVAVDADAEPLEADVDVAVDADAEPLEADFGVEYERNHLNGTSCPVVRTAFSDRSSGRPTAWLWEFPDGSISDQQNPVIEGNVWGPVRLSVFVGGARVSTERNLPQSPIC